MELDPFSSLEADTPEPSDSDCIGVAGAGAGEAGDDHPCEEIALEADSCVAVRIRLEPLTLHTWLEPRMLPHTSSSLNGEVALLDDLISLRCTNCSKETFVARSGVIDVGGKSVDLSSSR